MRQTKGPAERPGLIRLVRSLENDDAPADSVALEFVVGAAGRNRKLVCYRCLQFYRYRAITLS